MLNFARAGALGHPREDRTDPRGTRDRGAEKSSQEQKRDCGERCDQGDDDNRVRDARERGEDEADREQEHAEPAGEIDRAEDATQRRSRLPPATDEEHERRCEQEHGYRRPGDRGRDVCGMVVRDEDEVVRAGARLAGVPGGEEGVQERSEKGSRVTGDDEDSSRPAE